MRSTLFLINTKIISYVGPAATTRETITELLLAGS